MSWTSVFDAVFFISVGTLITGFLGLCVKYALKSKCEHFSCCCGLFTIDRRVDLELQAEMKELELEENKKEIKHINEV
jgi:hypothetical protein